MVFWFKKTVKFLNLEFLGLLGGDMNRKIDKVHKEIIRGLTVSST